MDNNGNAVEHSLAGGIYPHGNEQQGGNLILNQSHVVTSVNIVKTLKIKPMHPTPLYVPFCFSQSLYFVFCFD